MNVPLLQEIRARIVAEPDAFRMDVWSCGTAHCIAGWALVLNGMTVGNPEEGAVFQRLSDGRRPMPVAAELLGIGHYGPDNESFEETESDRLFCTYAWPSDFEERYESYDDDDKNGSLVRRARAQIAAERIDHFIATNGAE